MMLGEMARKVHLIMLGSSTPTPFAAYASAREAKKHLACAGKTGLLCYTSIEVPLYERFDSASGQPKSVRRSK